MLTSRFTNFRHTCCTRKITLLYVFFALLNNIYCRVDGGVAKNDFVCQHLADMIGVEVERATSTEMSGLGVAMVCGLTSGRLVQKTWFLNKSNQINFLKVFGRMKQSLKNIGQLIVYFIPQQILPQ